METVVAFAGARDPRALAERLARVLAASVPSAGARLAARIVAIDEIAGGVVALSPADAPDFEPLVDIHVSPERVAVVFGKLTAQNAAAAFVHDQARGGAASIEALRAQDGSFSAIVVDRAARTLRCATDLIGCRAPLWYAREGLLLLSPHALALVASGEVPLDWDPCSVASAACVDWSVGRRSLLAPLRTLKPYEVLEWRAAATRVTSSSPLRFDERIGRLDVRGLAANGERILDAMVEGSRSYCAGRSEVRLSLTSGLDSRAVLALLHGAGARAVLAAQTSGLPGSADVEGAARLAAMCGIVHKRNEPAPPSSEQFAANVRLTAFLQSGDANAKQCLGKLPRLASSGSVSGGGGEIYTGFYYPLFVPFGQAPDDPARIASTFMTRLRKARWSALGAWQAPLRSEAEQRLADELAVFQSFGAHGNDLADLMYLWERYGHWGAVNYRRPWSHGWTPFSTAGAVRALFRYPRGVGKHCDLHVRAIRRFLPLGAYLMPVNGTTFLPLTRPGEAAYMLRQAQIALGLVQKKVSTKLRTRANAAGVEQLNAEIFANEVYDDIHALLTDPQSLSIATFGDKAVRALLEQHRRTRSQLQPLGQLVMAEHFRALAHETAALARQ